MKTLKYIALSFLILATTLAAVLITKPAPVSPKSDVLVYDPDNVELKWTKSSPAASFDHYEVDVARDPSFAPATMVFQDPNVSPGNPDGNTLNIPPGTLNRARRYYWRVRGVDTAATPTAWTVAYFRTAVAPPALDEPLDGTALLNNRPTFKWNAVLNADSYTLQVSLYADFRSTLINATIANTKLEYTPTTDLPANKELYWRMRTNSAAYGPSAWTDFRTMTTAMPPTTPTPLQPASGKVTDDYSPRLVWTKTSVPSGTTFQQYEVEVATDDDFEAGDIVFQESATLNDINKPCLDINPPAPSTECGSGGVADLDPATTYYWRVRAYNTLGEYSNWSTVFVLRTALERVTNLTDPANGAQLDYNRPTFKWDNVPGATRYTISISPNPTMLSPILTRTFVTSTPFPAPQSEFTPTTSLPPNRTLYWRVRAEAQIYGPGAWSPVRSFTTANPPSVPTLVSPANNGLVTTLTPTFRWNPSFTPLGVNFDYYEIEITDDGSFATVDISDQIFGQFSILYTVNPLDALDPAKRYYWRMRACNDVIPNQCSEWSSSARSFRVAVQPPTLVAPVDGAADPYPAQPLFDWDTMPGATSYTFWFGTQPTTGTIFTTTVYPSEYQMLKIFKPGIYYWRVRANNAFGFGPSAWSDSWQYEITP